MDTDSILKQCVDGYLPYLTVTISYSLRENIFPEELKSSGDLIIQETGPTKEGKLQTS